MEKSSNPNRYSFEKKKGNSEQFKFNKSALLSRLEIDEGRLNQREKDLIDLFCSNNLHNIAWYKKRMFKERLYIIIYFCLTIIFLIGIPVLIYQTTDNMSEVPRSIAVLVSSLLAIHKFISDWIDRRKFRSLFNEASTRLKHILYAVHHEFNGKATVQSHPGHGFKGGYLTVEFVDAIDDGAQASREIVDAETQAFFDLDSNPSFDIGSIFKSSLSTANEILQSFRGKIKDEPVVSTGLSRKDSIKDTAGTLKKELKDLDMLGEKEEKICNELAEITAMEQPDDARKVELNRQLAEIRQEIDAKEEAVGELNMAL